LKLKEEKQFFNNILKYKPKENHMKIINNSYGLIFNILLTAAVLVLISACGEKAQIIPAPPPTPPDLHPPTQPTNLKATTFSISQINLSWEASVDPVVDTLGVSTGVKGYYIYRDGKKLRANQGTKFSDTGLESGKSYSYTVESYDGANNTSDMSTPASAATPKVSSEVVADWFAFAKNQEWDKMESIARKAWISDGVFCPWLCAKEIAWHYESIEIKSYDIKPKSDTDETLHTYQVIVTTSSGNKTMAVNVYKEIVSGQVSWGVDPIIFHDL